MVKVNNYFDKNSVIFTEPPGKFLHNTARSVHILKRVMLVKKPRYLFWILLAEAVGGLSGFVSRNGMQVYMRAVEQPPFAPPPWLFPIAWGILYALMGISVARVEAAEPSPARSAGLNLFIAQLIVNFFWSPIFFNARAYGLALLWLLMLWVLVLAMILSFRKVDRAAAWLQVPYLLWLTFAAYLNFGVWQLNP